MFAHYRHKSHFLYFEIYLMQCRCSFNACGSALIANYFSLSFIAISHLYILQLFTFMLHDDELFIDTKLVFCYLFFFKISKCELDSRTNGNTASFRNSSQHFRAPILCWKLGEKCCQSSEKSIFIPIIHMRKLKPACRGFVTHVGYTASK